MWSLWYVGVGKQFLLVKLSVCKTSITCAHFSSNDTPLLLPLYTPPPPLYGTPTAWHDISAMVWNDVILKGSVCMAVYGSKACGFIHVLKVYTAVFILNFFLAVEVRRWMLEQDMFPSWCWAGYPYIHVVYTCISYNLRSLWWWHHVIISFLCNGKRRLFLIVISWDCIISCVWWWLDPRTLVTWAKPNVAAVDGGRATAYGVHSTNVYRTHTCTHMSVYAYYTGI